MTTSNEQRAADSRNIWEDKEMRQMVRKTLRTACICICTALASAAGALAQPYEDAIGDIQVVASSPGELVVSVRYLYFTPNGDNVDIRAIPLDDEKGSEMSSLFGCVAWPIHAGIGRAYLLLKFTGADSIGSTHRLRIFLERNEHERGYVRFMSIDWPVVVESWTWQPDSIGSFIRTVSQNARELRVEASYTLAGSHSAAVFVQAQPLNGGTIGTSFGSAPGGPLSSGAFRTATVTATYTGTTTDYSDGLLLTLYEAGGGGFAYAVAPRIKCWAASTADRDRDGISDANEADLGTNPRSSDTDSDGLEDGWELEGYRWDGYQNADSNLPFYGASPRHRDVFVEVDYLSGLTGGMRHDHQLPVDTVHKAKDLYGSMPISNPDGRSGVAVHVVQDQMIEFDGDVGGVAGMRAFLSYFPERKRRIYHWAIAGHGGGGQAYNISNWLVFGTEGGWPYGGSWSVRDKFLAYATLVHELGHDIGLLHEGRSGRRQENCKPNYPSLMNYAYDYSFNCSDYDLTTTNIQFSNGNAPALSERALRETGNTGFDFVSGYDSDFLGCNYFSVSDAGDIDWNRNGVYEGGTVSVDCDGLTPSCCRTAVKDGPCIGGDGIRPGQRDSNDFVTVDRYMAESIRSPHIGHHPLTSAEQGYLYESDIPDLIEPVCGLPPTRPGEQHPWLRINPVFQLRPGMEIKHPAMRVLLAPFLDSENRLRPDVPIEVSPDPDPAVLAAPPEDANANPGQAR